MISEDQRIRLIRGLAQAKQQLQARGQKDRELCERLDNLERSLDEDFDYQLARSILRDLREPISVRQLGSTEPDCYKTLRDILNQLVTALDLERPGPKARPTDKSSTES